MSIHGLKGFLISALIILTLGVANSVAAKPVDFSLPDLNGKTRQLSEFRGKWVVVNYWATWCPPCLSEIPELVNFHEEHHLNDAVVIGINFEDISTDKLKAFAEDYFFNYPILRETPAASSVLGEIPGLPTTFIISPQGEIVARQVGSVTAELIENFIASQQQAEPVLQGL